jgi:excisionase family DNA binding protein
MPGEADSAYRPPEGYLTMGETQKTLRVSKATLQRMVRAGKLATYADPRNGRVRLTKAEDVARLLQPMLEEKTRA